MVQPYFRKRRSAGVNWNSSEWFGSGILSGAAAYCVTIGRSIYSAYESRLLGTIIINVNVRDLQELWPEPDQNFQEKFYLVDDENRVVFSDSSEEIGGQFSRSDLSVGISSCEMEGVLYDAMVSESGHQAGKASK